MHDGIDGEITPVRRKRRPSAGPRNGPQEKDQLFNLSKSWSFIYKSFPSAEVARNLQIQPGTAVFL